MITGYYIRYMGWGNFLLMVGATASYSFFVTFPQYWLKLWTKSGSNHAWFYMAGFLIFAFTAWTSTNVTMW
jgi:ATP-binding cassette subfamily C (CFTR/MRP) protein 1